LIVHLVGPGFVRDCIKSSTTKAGEPQTVINALPFPQQQPSYAVQEDAASKPAVRPEGTENLFMRMLLLETWNEIVMSMHILLLNYMPTLACLPLVLLLLQTLLGDLKRLSAPH
jgi:hypothetical protein